MSQVSIIDIEGSHPQIPTEFIGDSGSAIPIANQLEILGLTVAANTYPQAVYTTASGNTVNVNIPVSQAIAATDITKVGLSSFNSSQFTVDANGFVALVGGGAAIDSFATQLDGPVFPDVNGQVSISGSIGSVTGFPLRSIGSVANTVNLRAQVSSAQIATNIAYAGMASFDSTQFSVDGNGFVTLVGGSSAVDSFTPDTGTNPVFPTAGGLVNILGRSGSKTVGSTNTITVKSPAYADQGGSTSVTLNSGSFSTAAITLTTPVTAGLADGDLLEFVATNGVLVIQLAATQVAHLGNLTSSAAGTITSTSTGDAVCLRYQASTNDWWATSIVGTWLIA